MILLVGSEMKGAALEFEQHGNDEVVRILRELADRVSDGGNYFGLKDINGNTVGSAEFRMRDTLAAHDL